MFGMKKPPQPDASQFTLNGPQVHRLEIRYDPTTNGFETFGTMDKMPVLQVWMLLTALTLLEPDQLMFAIRHIISAVALGPAPSDSGVQEVPPGTLVDPGKVGPHGVTREAIEAARKKAGGN